MPRHSEFSLGDTIVTSGHSAVFTAGIPVGTVDDMEDSIIRMEEKIERHWYAFYVRMHHEKKTAEKLEMLHVEHFLPIQEVVRQWSDRKKRKRCVPMQRVSVVCIPMRHVYI